MKKDAWTALTLSLRSEHGSTQAVWRYDRTALASSGFVARREAHETNNLRVTDTNITKFVQ